MLCTLGVCQAVYRKDSVHGAALGNRTLEASAMSVSVICTKLDGYASSQIVILGHVMNVGMQWGIRISMCVTSNQ